EQAVEVGERMIKASTAWFTGYPELARFLVACPDPKYRNDSRGLELATQSIQLNPRHADSWNTLAIARYRMGEYPAALTALEKSESLRPGGHAADWFVSALIHWQLSKHDRAVTDYRLAVNWMAKHAPTDYELRILRDEAATLLKVEPEEKKRD